jgi:hypothetical protein
MASPPSSSLPGFEQLPAKAAASSAGSQACTRRILGPARARVPHEPARCAGAPGFSHLGANRAELRWADQPDRAAGRRARQGGGGGARQVGLPQPAVVPVRVGQLQERIRGLGAGRRELSAPIAFASMAPARARASGSAAGGGGGGCCGGGHRVLAGVRGQPEPLGACAGHGRAQRPPASPTTAAAPSTQWRVSGQSSSGGCCGGEGRALLVGGDDGEEGEEDEVGA